MEGEGKGEEGEVEKEQVMMGEKLKRWVVMGRRGGPCTPSPTWRFGFSAGHDYGCSMTEGAGFGARAVSARKLGANLWEFQPHLLQLAKMSKGRPHCNSFKNKGFELPTSQLAHTPDSPKPQPVSSGTLGGHVDTPLLQHRVSAVKRGHCLRHVSSAGWHSSTEVAPYIRAPNPTDLPFKYRIGESGYSLKTSTELIKVLNHIWSLEEESTTYKSQVKALTKEQNYSRAQIKELLQLQKADRKSMDVLLKKFSEDRDSRRNKKEDRFNATLESVQEELEDEKHLRKHSEYLHRKLAQELSKMKISLSDALKNLEQEKKARLLLEDLCDQLAKGIKEYEQKVRSLKHSPEKNKSLKESPDRLVLHISDAWLDERMQVKVSGIQHDQSATVNKLSYEIEAFLRAKEHGGHDRDVNKSRSELKSSTHFHRHSQESPLHKVAGVPNTAEDVENPIRGDQHFLKSRNGPHRKLRDDYSKQDDDNDYECLLQKGKNLIISNGYHSREDFCSQDYPIQGDKFQKVGINKVAEENMLEGNYEQAEVQELDKDLSRLKSEKIKTNCSEDCHDRCMLMHRTCPSHLETSRLTSVDPEISESPTRPQTSKKNTLKEKLLEARLEARQSRLRASKHPP